MPRAVSQPPSRRRTPGSADGLRRRSSCSGAGWPPGGAPRGRRRRRASPPAPRTPSAIASASSADAVGVLGVGARHHPRATSASRSRPRRGRPPAPARAPSLNSTSVAPCSSTRSAPVRRLRDAAQRRPRRQRQERRRAVGVHDQRRRVTGGGVGEVAGGGVEHAVEDRGALDVVHLGGEVVEGGEHGARRRVAQRRWSACAPRSRLIAPAAGTPWPTASPTTRASRPTPSGTASYQSPPAARADVARW